jgi:hypothetical protein
MLRIRLGACCQLAPHILLDLLPQLANLTQPARKHTCMWESNHHGASGLFSIEELAARVYMAY